MTRAQIIALMAANLRGHITDATTEEQRDRMAVAWAEGLYRLAHADSHPQRTPDYNRRETKG